MGFKPTAVSAIGSWQFREGREDVCHLTALFENRGCIAHSHANWLAPTKVRRIVIAGSRKMLVFDDTMISEKLVVYDRGIEFEGSTAGSEESVRYRTGEVYAPAIDATEPLRVECEHFLECVSSGRSPLTDAVVGLDVVRVLVAAQESMRQNGRCERVAYAS